MLATVIINFSFDVGLVAFHSMNFSSHAPIVEFNNFNSNSSQIPMAAWQKVQSTFTSTSPPVICLI